MGLVFCPRTNVEALDKIKSGEYQNDVLEYLKKDNGQISWGKEVKFVDSNSVYELFSIDGEEYVDYESMLSLKPSLLSKEFKKTIEAAYEIFLSWKEDQ